MEIDFGKSENSTPVIEVETVKVPSPSPTPTPEQPAPSTEQNTCTDVAPLGKLLGDKLPNFKDIILPRLNIVQNIGELKNTFLPGSMVFNQNLSLFIPPDINKDTGVVNRSAQPPVVITVFGFRPTRYVEKVQGGGRGLILDSEADVESHGGTTDYREWDLKKGSGMAYYQPLADAVVAVQRPDHVKDDDTVFVYAVDGKKYALGLWSLKGTAYTAAAKRVFFTARAVGCLRQSGYPSWSYNVTTRNEKFGTNYAWVPVCLPHEKSSPAFIEFVRSIIG